MKVKKEEIVFGNVFIHSLNNKEVTVTHCEPGIGLVSYKQKGIDIELKTTMHCFLHFAKRVPVKKGLNRNFDLTGKILFKVFYKLPLVARSSERFIIAESEEQAIAEMDSYDAEYYDFDLIEEDVSIVVLSEEKP